MLRGRTVTQEPLKKRKKEKTNRAVRAEIVKMISMTQMRLGEYSDENPLQFVDTSNMRCTSSDDKQKYINRTISVNQEFSFVQIKAQASTSTDPSSSSHSLTYTFETLLIFELSRLYPRCRRMTSMAPVTLPMARHLHRGGRRPRRHCTKKNNMNQLQKACGQYRLSSSFQILSGTSMP